MSVPAVSAARPRAVSQQVTRGRLALACAVAILLLGAFASLFVGASDLSVRTVLTGNADARDLQTLFASRVPRTASLLLAGSATAIAGLVMQLLVRNKFVEPSTAGTTESAALGLVLVTVFAPGMPLVAKMLVAAVLALAGTFLFLALLEKMPLKNVIVVPLIGMMLAGVIGAVTTFIAYEHDLLHTLSAWLTGDFSGVIRGRYELLYLVGLGAVIAYVAANRFTVAGLGEDITTSLGLHYRRTMALGLTVVAVVSAITVVVVGALPFLGLVVPNIVSLRMGDYLRRSLPWVAVLGAGFVLACDVIGRSVIKPAEVPIGVVVGTIGSGLFLYLLLRRGPGVR